MSKFIRLTNGVELSDGNPLIVNVDDISYLGCSADGRDGRTFIWMKNNKGYADHFSVLEDIGDVGDLISAVRVENDSQ